MQCRQRQAASSWLVGHRQPRLRPCCCRFHAASQPSPGLAPQISLTCHFFLPLSSASCCPAGRATATPTWLPTLRCPERCSHLQWRQSAPAAWAWWAPPKTSWTSSQPSEPAWPAGLAGCLLLDLLCGCVCMRIVLHRPRASRICLPCPPAHLPALRPVCPYPASTRPPSHARLPTHPPTHLVCPAG